LPKEKKPPFNGIRKQKSIYFKQRLGFLNVFAVDLLQTKQYQNNLQNRCMFETGGECVDMLEIPVVHECVLFRL